MTTLKARLKATWESGDYGVFAKYLEKGALEFFDRFTGGVGQLAVAGPDFILGILFIVSFFKVADGRRRVDAC